MKADIKDITLYTTPTGYLAIEQEDKSGSTIIEIDLKHFFNYIFLKDIPLKDYYDNYLFNYITLYRDLLELGYPLKDKIQEYLDNPDDEFIRVPIPASLYPIVRRYYKGIATDEERYLLHVYFELGGIAPKG